MCQQQAAYSRAQFQSNLHGMHTRQVLQHAVKPRILKLSRWRWCTKIHTILSFYMSSRCCCVSMTVAAPPLRLWCSTTSRSAEYVGSNRCWSPTDFPRTATGPSVGSITFLAVVWSAIICPFWQWRQSRKLSVSGHILYRISEFLKQGITLRTAYAWIYSLVLYLVYLPVKYDGLANKEFYL